jgi:hypothetical protein
MIAGAGIFFGRYKEVSTTTPGAVFITLEITELAFAGTQREVKSSRKIAMKVSLALAFNLALGTG